MSRGPGLAGALGIELADMLLRAWQRRNAEAERRARFADPAVRVGVEVIRSAHGAISEAEVAHRLKAVREAQPEWWFAAGVDPLERVGDVDQVVATGRSIVAIEVKSTWRGPEQLDQAARAARALGRLSGSHRVLPFLVVVGGDQPAQRHFAADGTAVTMVGPSFLASAVQSFVRGEGAFVPSAAPRLARQLHTAEQERLQISAAMAHCARWLARSEWLVASHVSLMGVSGPVRLLAAGPTGLFVAEPAGIDEHAAAVRAARKARQLATTMGGLRCEAIPVVLRGKGTPAEWLTMASGETVWGIDATEAAGWLHHTPPRAGVQPGQVARMRGPAPGWSYELKSGDDGGWSWWVQANHETVPPSWPRGQAA